jgi:hypothetical protein
MERTVKGLFIRVHVAASSVRRCLDGGVEVLGRGLAGVWVWGAGREVVVVVGVDVFLSREKGDVGVDGLEEEGVMGEGLLPVVIETLFPRGREGVAGSLVV